MASFALGIGMEVCFGCNCCTYEHNESAAIGPSVVTYWYHGMPPLHARRLLIFFALVPDAAQRVRILGHFREIKDKAFRAIEAGDYWQDTESSCDIVNLSWDVIRYLAAEAADNREHAWRAWRQEPVVLFRTAWDVAQW